LSKANIQLSTASHLVIYIYNADLYRFCGAENYQNWRGPFSKSYPLARGVVQATRQTMRHA